MSSNFSESVCACCCLLLIYIINDDDSIRIEYIVENISIKRAVSCQLLSIVKTRVISLFLDSWDSCEVSVESVESNVERKRFEGEKSKAKQQRQSTRGYISNSQIQNKNY